MKRMTSWPPCPSTAACFLLCKTILSGACRTILTGPARSLAAMLLMTLSMTTTGMPGSTMMTMMISTLRRARVFTAAASLSARETKPRRPGSSPFSSPPRKAWSVPTPTASTRWMIQRRPGTPKKPSRQAAKAAGSTSTDTR